MIYREAEIKDIAQIQVVRNAVKENRLSDPALVPDKDVVEYITNRGKGWVCETENKIVGFSIVDLIDNNVWALFIDPDFEAKGIVYILKKRYGWVQNPTAVPKNFIVCRAGQKLVYMVRVK